MADPYKRDSRLLRRLGPGYEPMTDDEARHFLTAFCDYAEKMGAFFPNGRPDRVLPAITTVVTEPETNG